MELVRQLKISRRIEQPGGTLPGEGRKKGGRARPGWQPGELISLMRGRTATGKMSVGCGCTVFSCWRAILSARNVHFYELTGAYLDN